MACRTKVHPILLLCQHGHCGDCWKAYIRVRRRHADTTLGVKKSNLNQKDAVTSTCTAEDIDPVPDGGMGTPTQGARIQAATHNNAMLPPQDFTGQVKDTRAPGEGLDTCKGALFGKGNKGKAKGKLDDDGRTYKGKGGVPLTPGGDHGSWVGSSSGGSDPGRG
jgi:hypothetical protein